jgi:elongation factor P
LLDGEPHALEDVQVQMPSARGAHTLVKVRARHVLTGQIVDRTFKAGDKFHEAEVFYRTARLLYSDGSLFHFMDSESYEQFSLPVTDLEKEAPWLSEELEVRSVHFQGRVAGIELPRTVICVVESVEPGSRGSTAVGKVLKNAVLDNGLTVQVPLYISEGERVRVETATGAFVERAAG